MAKECFVHRVVPASGGFGEYEPIGTARAFSSEARARAEMAGDAIEWDEKFYEIGVDKLPEGVDPGPVIRGYRYHRPPKLFYEEYCDGKGSYIMLIPAEED